MAIPLTTPTNDLDEEEAHHDRENDEDEDDYGDEDRGDGDGPEESASLLSRSTIWDQNPRFSTNNNNNMGYRNEEKERWFWYSRRLPRLLVLTLVCPFLFLVIVALVVLLPRMGAMSAEATATLRISSTRNIPVKYQCPKHVGYETAENFEPNMEKNYEKVSEELRNNTTEFLRSFRETDYDEWGLTYEEVKEGMRHFKSTYFVPFLKNGSTIYESACGIGLNLYMTLEILQETNGIENITLYGNELFGASADQANAIFEHIPPVKGSKGVICQANSAHLGFVPENSFDLVYTGYLYPLMDPLNLGLGVDDIAGKYESICNSTEELGAAAILSEVAQSRQNDWYGKWVAEMARIAKPGVPVIVEQTSFPVCDELNDWGGVRKEWWVESATQNTYGWNVDPSSVAFEDDTVFGGRYHVFMLKNGKQEKA